MAQSLRNQSNRPFSTSRRTNEEAQEASAYWMNVGMNHVDPETGEETFIAIGQGVPSNTIRPSTGGGELAQAKNYLARQIEDLAMSLEPGESTVVNLTVQIRRVGDAAAKIDPDNRFLNSLRLMPNK